MNDLLQRHGCSNVFSIPEGLKELMSDITREVLREQPPKMYDFIANYLSALLITREHGVLAVKVLEDLCDCKPSVSEHLLQIGLDREQAKEMSEIIKEQVEDFEPSEGKEKVREMEILKKILAKSVLDEDMTAKVCQIARNAFKDYWYRKRVLQKSLSVEPEEPWELAAQRTLEIYKKTKPSFSELTRATQRIQAAYRGYHVRKNLLDHLKPKLRPKPKLELPGPPLDIAASRDIDLGPIINVTVKDEDVKGLFDAEAQDKLNLKYDPMKAITHVEAVEDEAVLIEAKVSGISRVSKASMPKAAESLLLHEAEKEGSLGSRIDEKAPLTPTDSPESMLKVISFAKVSAEVITDIPGDQIEEVQDLTVAVSEEPAELADEGPEADDTQEVPEELVVADETLEPREGLEAVQEVPEDVTDADQSEQEGASEPTVLSSAPEDDATDVEDAGDMATSGEEEGE